ncbi:Hypothetical predicted protein [Lecanosticta acicola]|uniref:Uncharacterized protein n=1 Tax=Lecanosticta acicola TaxID=111012 RepID=A0AAI8Z858_9PEZI|nr:Hypothetical predicted protein [Lecanosticta acicola]
MSAILIKSGLGLGVLAAPFAVAYVFTADHSSLTFGTKAAHDVADRFSNFHSKAYDTHLSAEEQARRRKDRHAMVHEQIRNELL